MKVRYTIHEKSKMIGTVDEVDERLGNRLIATHCAVLVTEDELAAEAKAKAAAEELAAEAKAKAAAADTPQPVEFEEVPADKPAPKPVPKSAK